MWNPGHSCGPSYFLDVLNDEEAESLDSDGDNGIENNEVDEELITEEQDFECLIDNVESELSTVGPDEELASDNIGLDGSEDDSEDLASVQDPLNSLSRLSTAPESSMDAVRSSKLIQGYTIRRRGTRNRSKDLVSNFERGEHVRSRGDPLVERFASDEDLPELLRGDCTTVTAERDKATRASRAAVDLELEESASDADVNNVSDEFSWASMDAWCGEKEIFQRESSGPAKVYENEYDAFRSFWDDSLLSRITEETNRHALRIPSDRFHQDWFETNIHELLILYAFWIMLDVLKMPTIKACFSKIPILQTDIFRTLFSEVRYWNLNRAFRLANGSRDVTDLHNVIQQMGCVLEQLNLKFKQNYCLQQEICIDESFTIWKGPVGIKQCNKTRSTQLGIKVSQLRECSTGYLWSFLVHTCNRVSDSTQPSSVSTAVKLVRPLLNLGHVVYTTNSVNSPKFARYLKSKNTDCVGLLRSNQRHLPAVIHAPLADGEFVARQSGDVMVISLHDRGRVNYISTFHDLTQVEKPSEFGRPAQRKLKLIDDYHRNIGGVDRMDEMLEPYLLEGKQCGKLTKFIFKRLLNITIQNARILFEQSTKSKMDGLAFRMSLVQFIIERHLYKIPSASPLQQGNSPQMPSPPLPPSCPPRTSYPQFPRTRLTERHFVRRIPVTEVMLASIQHRTNLGRRQCAWCSATGRRRSKTVYECLRCNVPLCLEPCFEEFHTVP